MRAAAGCRRGGRNPASSPRAWVKPGAGGAGEVARERVSSVAHCGKQSRRQGEPTPPPERRSRAGLPSRDRGRRAEGNGDRCAAVAERCFVDAGRPEGRQTKARHRRVSGWRPGEGRKGRRFATTSLSRSIKYPSSKTILPRIQ